MKALAILLAIVFTVPAALANQTEASIGSTETAKVIVVRGKESHKTRGVAFSVQADDISFGRFTNKTTKTMALPTGTHTFDTTLRHGKSLDVDLKAGDTVYIKVTTKLKSGKYVTGFEVMTEEYANNNFTIQ